MRWVLDALETGDTRSAALHSLYLGLIVAEVNAMRFDDLVRTGRKVRGGGRKGAQNANRDAKQNRERYRTLANELWMKHSEKSLTAIRKLVAEKTGVSQRTIIRHTKKLPHPLLIKASK